MSFDRSTVTSEISRMQKANGKLRFVRAWAHLQKTKPHLFRESAEAQVTFDYVAEVKRAREHVKELAQVPVVVTCELPYTLSGAAPEEILYLPRGRTTIHARVNGAPQTVTVEVDESTAAALQADLLMRLARPVKPIGGFNHKPGAASFLPRSFSWDPGRGVVLKRDWTRSGKEAIEGRDFMHFSPTFTMAGDRVKGLTERGEIGSLTNSPAFENLGAIVGAIACEADDDVYETDPWYH